MITISHNFYMQYSKTEIVFTKVHALVECRKTIPKSLFYCLK